VYASARNFAETSTRFALLKESPRPKVFPRPPKAIRLRAGPPSSTRARRRTTKTPFKHDQR
jgi:hypothetical protein